MVGHEGGAGKNSFRTGALTLETPDGRQLLVTDNAHRVAVFDTASGAFVRQLTGPAGTLAAPDGVVVVPSTGEVLVSEWSQCRVVVFRSVSDDTVVRTLGGPAALAWPCGLAVLDGILEPGQAGGPQTRLAPTAVVVDSDNHRLVLFRIADGSVVRQLGSNGSAPGQFNQPRAVAVTSAGHLLVTDDFRVQVLT